MAHAQKADLVFRRNGRVHLNRRRASVQSTTSSRGVCISGNNVRYTMFRGSVKGTGYPLHSPVSLSLPFPCVTVRRHISTGLYIVCSCEETLLALYKRAVTACTARLNIKYSVPGFLSTVWCLQWDSQMFVRGTNFRQVKVKGKAVLLQAWSGPEGSRKFRFPDFMTTA